MKITHAFSKILATILLLTVPPQSLAANLSGGGYHAVHVDQGVVKGLGDGTYGQLGTTPTGAPATLTGLSGITDVAAGGFSTLALKSDGTVWFLGESTIQHTTAHGTPNPVSTPVQVAGLSGIDAIAAGHRHYLALDADTGNLYTWGHNGSGQIGNGSLLDVVTPAIVLTGVTAMDAGDGFSLVVKSDHTLWAWGRNTHGQLGLGDTTDRLSPTQITGVTAADAVAAGGQHALILLTDGTVLATGNNTFGQLGLGTTTSTSTPTAVPSLSGITTVSAGYFHSASIGSANQVSLWGRNFEGQCGGGNSSAVTYTSPQALTGLTGTPTIVSCGYHFTMIKHSDGTIMGTGSNSDGQLDGTSVADQSNSQKILTPQLIPLSADVTAPTPDPMTFSLPPVAYDATSITMTATTANDISGPVEYYFKNTTNNNVRDWSTSASWINTGLTTGASYSYQVKARDSLGFETAFSTSASAVPSTDTTPPTPSTMSFTTAPTALNSASITMTAATATDASGVEYYFDCTTSGGHDSGWQDSPTYTDTGLAPSNTYSYRVQARDKSSNQNTTGFSTPAPATTNPFEMHNASFEVDENTDSIGAFGAADRGSFGGELTGWISQSGSDNLVSVGWKDITTTELHPYPASGSQESQALSLQTGASVLNTTNTAWSSLHAGDELTLTISLGMRNLGILDWNEGTFFGFTDSATNFADGITPSDTIANSGVITNNPATGTQSGDGTFTDVSFSYTVQASDLIRPGNIGILIYVEGNNPSTSHNQSFFDNVRLNRSAAIINDFTTYMATPAFGLDPSDQGFTDDPDGDGLKNGLEAWFGTHPGQFNSGLANVFSSGLTTSFTHTHNTSPPDDLTDYYEWSPDLSNWYRSGEGPSGGIVVTFSANTVENTTTVTATASATNDRIFLRAGVSQN
ncbi:MAG: hypothetical protein AB8F34_08040 [Akkermansiaceae bacterium]